jgi:hypothetical protein
MFEIYNGLFNERHSTRDTKRDIPRLKSSSPPQSLPFSIAATLKTSCDW